MRLPLRALFNSDSHQHDIARHSRRSHFGSSPRWQYHQTLAQNRCSIGSTRPHAKNIRAGGSPDDTFNMKSHNPLGLPIEKRSLMIQKTRSKLVLFCWKRAFRLGSETPCRATWHFLFSPSAHFRQLFGSRSHQTFVLVSDVWMCGWWYVDDDMLMVPFQRNMNPT